LSSGHFDHFTQPEAQQNSLFHPDVRAPLAVELFGGADAAFGQRRAEFVKGAAGIDGVLGFRAHREQAFDGSFQIGHGGESTPIGNLVIWYLVIWLLKSTPIGIWRFGYLVIWRTQSKVCSSRFADEEVLMTELPNCPGAAFINQITKSPNYQILMFLHPNKQ
jgi:hypothetical protein